VLSVLAEAGMGVENLAKVTVFLASREHRAANSTIRGEVLGVHTGRWAGFRGWTVMVFHPRAAGREHEYAGGVDEDAEFAGALIRLSLAVQYVHQDLSRQHDLTPQQAQLVCSLIERPVGMAELSDRLHIEKSTLTGLVDRAERRHLVHRTPDPCDRRALRVALTAEGRALADVLYRAVTRALLAHLASLPAETLRQLRDVVPPTATVLWDAVGCSARRQF
jgi:DNA-binding MarR family transcriptional regulator